MSRIVLPNDGGVTAAVERDKALKALQNNPMFAVLAQTHQTVSELTGKLAMMTVHMFALFDYLHVHNMLNEEPTFEQFRSAHEQIAMFLPNARERFQSGRITMKEFLDEVRQFNANKTQLVKIRGTMFGLDVWLSENPDGLSDEELDNLAAEFGLFRLEESNEEDTANTVTAVESSCPTQEELPFAGDSQEEELDGS